MLSFIRDVLEVICVGTIYEKCKIIHITTTDLFRTV